MEWEDTREYAMALSAVAKVRNDVAVFMHDAWDEIWGKALGSKSAEIQMKPHLEFCSPQYIWDYGEIYRSFEYQSIYVNLFIYFYIHDDGNLEEHPEMDGLCLGVTFTDYSDRIKGKMTAKFGELENFVECKSEDGNFLRSKNVAKLTKNKIKSVSIYHLQRAANSIVKAMCSEQ